MLGCRGAVAGAALQQAQRSLNFANTVALMVDAQACHEAGGGLSKRELALANRIVQEGRAILIILNKLDLLPEPQQQQVGRQTSHILPLSNEVHATPVSEYPVLCPL